MVLKSTFIVSLIFLIFINFTIADDKNRALLRQKTIEDFDKMGVKFGDAAIFGGFQDHATVDFRKTKIESKDLAPLKDIYPIYNIILSDTKIDDAAFELLRSQPIQSIILCNTIVTGKGLDNLIVKGVNEINLSGTSTNDESIKTWISPSHDLFWLDLSHTKIGNKSIPYLVNKKNISTIILDSTQIDDDSATEISRFAFLRYLDVGHTIITDKSIGVFAGIKQMKSLFLNGTSVTDACIQDLEKMQFLEILDIRKTKISKEGFAKLQKHFPDCKIDY